MKTRKRSVARLAGALLLGFFSCAAQAGLRIDVRDFGAKGDGLTDDSDAVQKALDKAASYLAAEQARFWWQVSMPEVVVPEGTYRISRPLLGRRAVTFVGCAASEGGRPKATLAFDDGVEVGLYLERAFRCTVRNLRFRGGVSHLAFWTANDDTAAVLVEDCVFENAVRESVWTEAWRDKPWGSLGDVQTQQTAAHDVAPFDVSRDADGRPVLTRVARRHVSGNSTRFSFRNCAFVDCGAVYRGACDGSYFSHIDFRSSRPQVLPVWQVGSIVRMADITVRAALPEGYTNAWIEAASPNIDVTRFRAESTTRRGAPLFANAGKIPAEDMWGESPSVNFEDCCVDAADSPKGALLVFRNSEPTILAVRNCRERRNRPIRLFDFALPLQSTNDLSRSLCWGDVLPARLTHRWLIDGNGASVSANVPEILVPCLERPVPASAVARFPALDGAAADPCKGPFETLSSEDFGLTLDAFETDATDKLQRLFDAAEKLSNPRVLLPGRTIQTTRAIRIPRKVQVVGCGRSIIRAVSNDHPVLLVKDGKRPLAIGFDNVGLANGSLALAADGEGAIFFRNGVVVRNRGFRLARRGKPLSLDVWDSVVYSPRFVEADGADVRLKDSWAHFLPEGGCASMFLVRGGTLRCESVLGVPVVGGDPFRNGRLPSLAADEFAFWIRNEGGVVRTRNFRFGAEFGGLSVLDQYGAGAALLETSYASFVNPSGAKCAFRNASDAAAVVMDHVSVIGLLDKDVRLGRGVCPKALHVRGSRLEACDFEALSFLSAVPVWPEGRVTRPNDFVGFRADFAARKGAAARLRIAASTLYRVWVNGRFVGCGPVRAAHGYCRMDEWDLVDVLQEGRNAVAVEVSAFNRPALSFTVQPAFLQAEVTADGQTLCATGRDFAFVDLPREANVSRFSNQRPFHEVYRLTPDGKSWRTSRAVKGAKPVRCPQLKVIPRLAPYPEFRIRPARPIATTAFDFDTRTPREHPELAFDGWDLLKRLRDVRATATSATGPVAFARNRGALFDLGFNDAGFVRGTVTCKKPGTLYLVVDEVLMDGLPDPLRRLGIPMVTVWNLTRPGRYEIEAFEPTACRYIHAFMTDGEAVVSDISLREYKNPQPLAARFACDDPRLERLFAAAQETCAQSTMDAPFDGPSRERNVCLCDTWFSLAASRLLTGNSEMERLLLDCYSHPESYPADCPKGWFPSFYPGTGGSNIPNWPMWFIVELARYVRETGDHRAADLLKPRVQSQVEALRAFRNADGLLEKLPFWVFVTWDASNGLTQDVNYPSNMLWAEALDAVAELYGDPACAAEAGRVRETVRRQSWDGTWFHDNAVRQPDGTLARTEHRTETCQYYAFFFGVATPQTHAELWRKLVNEFGPLRRAKGLHLDVPTSETFIGIMLRLNCLMRWGCDRKALEDGVGWFLHMADRTGTLWEGLIAEGKNSCSHGYASYLANVLASCAAGVREIDLRARRVTLRAPEGTGLSRGSLSVPTPDGWLSYAWSREGGELKEEVSLPPEWKRTEEKVERPRIARSPDDPAVGRRLPPWQKGEFEIHSVYTGTGENQFWIFPDGTTVVCDTGDFAGSTQADVAPRLPSAARTGGEWMARYIQRVSPDPTRIDYMIASHWHSDHCGDPTYAYVTADGRKTSGLATVGEFFRIGQFFDNQYPEHGKYHSEEAPVMKMMETFAARAKERHGTVQEPFRVGALDQIALRHDRDGAFAKLFHVRNLCANGVVWTGCGTETRDYAAEHLKVGGTEKNLDQNLLSLGVVISYGPFRFYSAGDANGCLLTGPDKWMDYETLLGSVVGPVDVCKENHHGWRWTMPPAFVRAVRAAVYVGNVWEPYHIQSEQMATLTDRSLYPGARLVFPTYVFDRSRVEHAGAPWWRDLPPMGGHVVVKVAPGGASYRVFTLSPYDEELRVTGVWNGIPAAAAKTVRE